MSREEQLQLCKDRALAYLPKSPVDAVTSFMSDTEQAALIDWQKPAYATLSQLGMLYMMHNSVDDARRWIEGFN